MNDNNAESIRFLKNLAVRGRDDLVHNLQAFPGQYQSNAQAHHEPEFDPEKVVDRQEMVQAEQESRVDPQEELQKAASKAVDMQEAIAEEKQMRADLRESLDNVWGNYEREPPREAQQSQEKEIDI